MHKVQSVLILWSEEVEAETHADVDVLPTNSKTLESLSPDPQLHHILLMKDNTQNPRRSQRPVVAEDSLSKVQ